MQASPGVEVQAQHAAADHGDPGHVPQPAREASDLREWWWRVPASRRVHMATLPTHKHCAPIGLSNPSLQITLLGKNFFAMMEKQSNRGSEMESNPRDLTQLLCGRAGLTLCYHRCRAHLAVMKRCPDAFPGSTVKPSWTPMSQRALVFPPWAPSTALPCYHCVFFKSPTS